jgi:hypothetical protein
MVDHTPDHNDVQFALHGLLALGSKRTASDPAMDSPVRRSRVPNTTEPHYTIPSLTMEPGLRIAPNEAHAEYNVNLMKVYRYQIAPWVSRLIQHLLL